MKIKKSFINPEFYKVDGKRVHLQQTNTIYGISELYIDGELSSDFKTVDEYIDFVKKNDGKDGLIS